MSYLFSKPPIEIVKEYFPTVTDDEAGYILWNWTGWPSFWKGDPEESMRQQLADIRDGKVDPNAYGDSAPPSATGQPPTADEEAAT